jgi:hypothetical protein
VEIKYFPIVPSVFITADHSNGNIHKDFDKDISILPIWKYPYVFPLFL